MKKFFCLGLIVSMSMSLNAQSSLLDPSFDPGSGAQGDFVESMALQPDGKILICGDFTSFGGMARSYIARLNSNGTVDTSFNASVGYWVRTMALQADGKIVIGGFFTTVGGQSRNRVARLNANGSLDTTFNPGTGCSGKIVDADPTDPFIFASAIQSDGKIIIGGNFTNYNGAFCSGLARLNTNGTLDTTFSTGSGMNSWVRSLSWETNGNLFVSGWFTSYNNHSCNRLIHLHPDGSLDSGFVPYFGDSTAIYTTAKLSNSQMIVGGHSVNSSAPFRQEVLRLNTDGSYDTSFNPSGSGANEKVESLLVQSDGKIVIAGYFNFYNGTQVQGIARLNSNGTLDRSLLSQIDNWIWTILLQPDGRLLFCGGFTTVDGVSRSGIARLLPDSTLRLLNPHRNGSTFSVSVATETGGTYRLQYRNSLSDNWTSLPSVTGNGTTQTLSDTPATAQQRFYRISKD